MVQGPNIGVLKAVVIGLGLLIVVSVAIVAYGVAQKFSKLAAPPAAKPAVATAVPAGAFGTVTVQLPAGSRFERSEISGDRLLVQAIAASGTRHLIVVDLLTGNPVGTVVVPAGPGG